MLQCPRFGLPYVRCAVTSNVVEQKDRTWETICHLAALLRLVPFLRLFNVIGPFIIWIIRKNQSHGVDQHGRAAINFQLSMTLYFFLLLVVQKLPLPYLDIPAGICLRAWEYINLFFILRATYEAAQGRLYKYPFSIRILPQ